MWCGASGDCKGTKLRRVVDVVFGEESVEQSEVTSALNLLRVAADHRDGFALLTHSNLLERGRRDSKSIQRRPHHPARANAINRLFCNRGQC
jgi:hypothetical protein